MAQLADSLLMNLYLKELDLDDHCPSKITSSIIGLMENGAINDDAIISVLLSHHHQQDKVQQQRAAYILADLCFNRLIAFRAFNNQIQTKKKEDTKEFMQLFCVELCKLTSYLMPIYFFPFTAAKMISSFKGEKDWEFTQIFSKMTMKILKQD